MAALGPFEPKPRIAVAVSGGADSMTLALLAAGWARKAGGAAVALTVDHGLRPESAAEARQVARWMRARKIAHRTLRCGTLVRITSPRGNVVTVPVIDRGPYVAGRSLDLANATRLALACTDLCRIHMLVIQ